MRVAGMPLQPEVARLLAQMLDDDGFPDTAARITDAIERQITVEAPLTPADYGAILETLNRTCPPTLYKLRRVLLEDQRYVRKVTGG
jgi:hypothetical protein